MRFSTFLRFVGPSAALMMLLLALPLAVTFYLSVRSCALQMEVVTVTESSPFGTKEVVTQRAVLGPDGRALSVCRFVGLEYFRKVLGLDAAAVQAGSSAPPDAGGAAEAVEPERATEFMGALRFTLLYTFATTPFVLLLGFALALGVNQVGQRWRPMYISASLLPFIITPVVGALAIKWLFRDNGLVPYFLSQFGISLFWMAQAWSARLLIILYGIWHVVPFAFIVFYAGLQSVPQDSLEAARIDGANSWQRLWYVTLPHLAPLFVFVTLIHLMDAYRVFEPVMVLTQGAFTTSVQYLTYYILMQENNPYKASAAAVLTTAGIAVLLVPLLVRTWKEQRRGG
ncbi:MAG: ABC transporter permease subunit [Comamonadaceae bacterium]|nr:MAG: ABC transporter permease subunit [Comamonadaceae bacterium]